MTDDRWWKSALDQDTEDSAVPAVKWNKPCISMFIVEGILPIFVEAEFISGDAVHSTFINAFLSGILFSYLLGEASSAYKATFVCFL